MDVEDTADATLQSGRIPRIISSYGMAVDTDRALGEKPSAHGHTPEESDAAIALATHVAEMAEPKASKRVADYIIPAKTHTQAAERPRQTSHPTTPAPTEVSGDAKRRRLARMAIDIAAEQTRQGAKSPNTPTDTAANRYATPWAIPHPYGIAPTPTLIV